MVELHKQGASKEDVIGSLQQLPVVSSDGICRTMLNLHAASSDETGRPQPQNPQGCQHHLLVLVQLQLSLHQHNIGGKYHYSTAEIGLINASQHQGMTDIFEEIITNPAEFKESGLLEINRRILASAPKQHSCKVGCSANMCKGAELEAFLERKGGRSTFDKIIYVGDGSNDFCPLLRLTK